MLAFTMLLVPFTVLFAAFVSGVPTPRSPGDYQKGAIVAPAANSTINPGDAFNFTYNVRADYCESSYNYTVWLLTAEPKNMQPSADFMTGYYFGRFSSENYPANPNPSNPPPAQLTMPNLSLSPGGFGSGSTASDATFYIAVMEEWDDCDRTLGTKISYTANPFIYNVTSSSSS